MCMQPVAWPVPDPQVAAVIAAMYGARKTERPLAVLVLDRLGQWLADGKFAAAFEARGKPGWSSSRLTRLPNRLSARVGAGVPWRTVARPRAVVAMATRIEKHSTQIADDCIAREIVGTFGSFQAERCRRERREAPVEFGPSLSGLLLFTLTKVPDLRNGERSGSGRACVGGQGIHSGIQRAARFPPVAELPTGCKTLLAFRPLR